MVDCISVADLHRRLLTEIEGGGGLSLSAAGKLFPAHHGGGTVRPSTIYRWRVKGLRAPDGRVIKLEALRVGARWVTSRGAVARFVEQLTAAADPDSSAIDYCSPTQRDRAAEAAGRALENEFGF